MDCFSFQVEAHCKTADFSQHSYSFDEEEFRRLLSKVLVNVFSIKIFENNCFSSEIITVDN